MMGLLFLLAAEASQGKAASRKRRPIMAARPLSISAWALKGPNSSGLLFLRKAASFAPVLRGKSSDEAFLKNSKPEEFGPFNAQAEMLNGRAAMMGLLFLLA